MDITSIEYAIPNIIKIKPGIPRYLKGRLSAISSMREFKTSAVCETGFFVDVSYPVS